MGKVLRYCYGAQDGPTDTANSDGPNSCLRTPSVDEQSFFPAHGFQIQLLELMGPPNERQAQHHNSKAK